jgi:GTP-dependent phosphoenolpyruvate carboxykinase
LALSEVTRVGEAALEALNPRSFVKLVHTRTLRAGERPIIVHFPESQEAWSVGTDSVRGAVLAPTAHALRIASYQAVNEGWLVAKAAVVTITPPNGPVKHVAATFLNAGDAEAFAVSLANRDGWRVQVALTGALFLHVGQDGRLWAIAPERVDPFQPHGLPPGSIHDYRGIPISAFLYFVRRADTMPLVLEARNWRHGTSLAASLATERSGARLEQDPLGLIANSGVNMGDYLEHWLAYGRTLHETPKVFCVNLDRTGSDGRPLWPGGAENVRLLAWMHGRMEGARDAISTSVGLVPDRASPAFNGLDIAPGRFDHLTAIDASAWVAEADRASSFLSRLGSRLPLALYGEIGAQQKKLVSSIH